MAVPASSHTGLTEPADTAHAGKVRVEDLYKIFGRNAAAVLDTVRSGKSKDEVLRETKHTVGLNGVSLSVNEGETFVVMGLSGSGKSTLVRCLNRLIEPTAGRILIDGEDITGLSAHEMERVRREKMGMVFQHFALFPHRNVIDNVAYGLKVRGEEKEERHRRARRWIEAVGLAGYEQSRPAALSGGMQQRVGLARALATDPEILLMDEAFSALDPLIRREMQDLLIRLQRRLNKTIVFITHDLDEALRLGDRVAILKDGHVVQVGTPVEILTQPADDYVSSFVEHVDRGRVLTAATAMERPQTVSLATRPGRVLESLRSKSWDCVFVVDDDGTYVGVATRVAVSRGERVGSPDLRPVVSEEAPTVAADAPLSSLLALSADSDLPIAVLDDDKRLVGTLSHSALLGALAAGDNGMGSGASKDAEAVKREEPAPVTGGRAG